MKRLDHYLHCPGRRELSRVIVLCGCLLLFASCHKDDSEASIAPQSPIPVGFTTAVKDEQTRGDVLNNANLTSLGVFASYTGGSDWAATDAPNFMYNQKIERANNSSPWTYSPLKYWPADENEKISFFAYAPHNPVGLTTSVNTAEGYPVLTYTVPTAEADQTDLLAAAPLMNQTGSLYPNASAINFSMSHALTKVVIRVKSGDKYAKEVTNLSLKAASSGELHFKNGGFEWENMGGSSTYSPKNSTVQLSASDVSKDIATFFMLPTGAVTATISITYTVKMTSGDITETITNQSLPATPLWTPGNSIVYTINLSEKAVSASTDAAGSSWETTGSEEKLIKSFTADELKVGDYYYSDGTTSDGGLRQAFTTSDAASGGQSPDMLLYDYYKYDEVQPITNGKTCIGIVFYVGQGEGDNISNYSSFSMTQIDGYVLALSDAASGITWGLTGGAEGIENTDPVTGIKFDGYANTEKAKADIDSYPAFKTAISYTTSRPPTKASTWYLPSIAQIRSILSVHGATIAASAEYKQKIVYKNLQKAGGAAFSNQRYWSSSSFSTTDALYAGFNYADIKSVSKSSTHSTHSRSVLTFQRATN